MRLQQRYLAEEIWELKVRDSQSERYPDCESFCIVPVMFCLHYGKKILHIQAWARLSHLELPGFVNGLRQRDNDRAYGKLTLKSDS